MIREKGFSDRLKQAMELRGLKQVELCARTHIPKSALSQYLKGSFAPKQDRLWALARALEVDPAWLMGHDVPMEPAGEPEGPAAPDPLAQQLFAAYNGGKEVFDQDDIDDIKLFMEMVAQRKRRKQGKE